MTLEVAYTESLEIKSGTGSITMGFLDTMSGSAALSSQGKGITVNGLDGTAHLESHGGPIQVRAKPKTISIQLQTPVHDSAMVHLCIHIGSEE